MEALPPCLEHDALFLYVESGCGTIVINGQEFPLEEGAFCYLQNYHVYQLIAEGAHTLHLLACIFDYQLSSYFPISAFLTPKQYAQFFQCFPIVQANSSQQERLRTLFALLENQDAESCNWDRLVRVSAIGQLLVEWIQIAYAQKQKKNAISTAWLIWMFIAKFNGSDMTAEEVAAYFGKSISAMNRELRTISGYNFNQLLSRSRIGQACTGILMGDLSFCYIAACCGFHSEVSFYRAFSVYRGMTPQQYREKMLNTTGTPRYVVNDLSMAIILYIANHYREPVTISKTAKLFFVTEAAVSTGLKTSFNYTFQSVLLFFRLRYAKALLVSGDAPILDICLNSGWNSVYTFIRQFKQETGMTPSEFRRRSKDELGR